MFLILKQYPNRDWDDSIEPICTAKNGQELDKKILEIGECQLDVYALNYWEVKNINLETMEMI